MSSPRQKLDRAARRRAILDSAIRIFAERGFNASHTRDIAAGAGVAEGTIYLYYESKAELLLTAFREEVGRYCAVVDALAEQGPPFAEGLTRFIREQFERIEADPAYATVLLLESRQTTQFHAGAVREVLREYAGAVERLLESGVREGAVQADVDVPLARRMLVGALEEIELDWLIGGRACPLAPQAERVAETFRRGIAAPREDG